MTLFWVWEAESPLSHYRSKKIALLTRSLFEWTTRQNLHSFFWQHRKGLATLLQIGHIRVRAMLRGSETVHENQGEKLAFGKRFDIVMLRNKKSSHKKGSCLCLRR